MKSCLTGSVDKNYKVGKFLSSQKLSNSYTSDSDKDKEVPTFRNISNQDIFVKNDTNMFYILLICIFNLLNI